MVNALALEADEGRNERRNVSGSSKYALIREFPNGETCLESCLSVVTWINSVTNSNPVNWTILVTGGEERKQSITPVVASEKVTAQTDLRIGVVGHYIKKL